MKHRKLLNFGHGIYSYMMYLLPLGYSLPPPLVVWEISNKCNLRCAMCPLFGKNKVELIKGKELNFDEVKKIIDDLKIPYRFLPYKPFIGFTGGEPFMRKDIIKIFRYLRKKDFDFSVTTNFSIPNEEMINNILDSGLSDLRISLDGPREVHDRVRGKGVFDKVMNNLKLIRQNNKGRKFPIRLNCTISKYNYSSIPEMVGIAATLKADLSFQFVEFIDEKHFEAHKRFSIKRLGGYYPTKLDREYIKEEEVKQIIAFINQAKKLAKQRNVKLYFTPDITDKREIREYFTNMNGYLHSKKCIYPWGTARINSYGDIFPCIDYSYGNLRKHKFSEVWNSKMARRFRETLKKYKLFPGCIRCCHI